MIGVDLARRTLFLIVLVFDVVLVHSSGAEDVWEDLSLQDLQEGISQEEILTHVSSRSSNPVQFSMENQSDPLLHEGFRDYCHLHGNRFEGNEGESIRGFRIKKVLVLLSPGQRSFNVDFENVTSPTVSCNFDHLAKNSKEDKIHFLPEVANLYRHMQPIKGGFKSYDMYPNKEGCSNGDLSPLGSVQHVRLGEHLGRRYSKLKLHQPSRSENLVSARCIQSEAAYQSLFSFLHGVLHEKNLVNVIMHKSPNNFCRHSKKLKCTCPKTEYLEDKISKALRRGYHVFKDSANIDESINRQLQLPAHTEMAARDLINFLSSWICEVKGHPCKDGVCLNVSISNLNRVFQSANKHFQQLASSTTFQNYAKLQTYHFFKNWFTWLEDGSDPSLSAFVAEEDFLLMVLSVLGAQTDAILPQASRVVFEVHGSVNETVERSILRVYLNGVDVSRKLSVRMSGKDELEINSVVQFYRKYILESFKNKNYLEECKS